MEALPRDIKNLSAHENLPAHSQGHHPGGDIHVHSKQLDLLPVRLAVNLAQVNADPVQDGAIVRT